MNFLNIKKENDLCWVYLNRPDAMNALNNELLRELTEFNHNLKNDLDTKVAVSYTHLTLPTSPKV